MAALPLSASDSQLREISGQHLALWTDLPSAPAIDDLPRRFDQAVPQWCARFSVSPERAAQWRVTGYLMKDGNPFRRAGLLPEGLPDFQHGFTRDREFWVWEQPSDYFRTHLVLHEGTHAFMFAALGGCGPPWYMEGLAEQLATHRIVDDRLELGVFPHGRDEVPYWGRIRLIELARSEGRALSLPQLLELSSAAYAESSSYAWSWAAAALCELHPRYHEAFGKLTAEVRGAALVRQPREIFGPLWSDLLREWPRYLADLDYGYNFSAMQLDLSPARRSIARPERTIVLADRGWQNTGLKVTAGAPYAVQAQGRFQVQGGAEPWTSEADGVTLRYYRGQPLGRLLAVVLDDQAEPGNNDVWSSVVPLASQGRFTPSINGTLYLRVNDAAGDLDDNRGQLEVELGLAPPMQAPPAEPGATSALTTPGARPATD